MGEAQGFESSRFKAIFPDGLIIKKGGMASGLKKAETNEHEPKLFKVAGGIRPVMTEVPMAWSSMNHGDVFVLDSGKKIFVWRGAQASGSEKMAAGLIAARLRDHVGEEITHLEEGDLSKDDLDGNDAFLVSAGALGIWVWLGRQATSEERQCAMQLGEKFIKEKELPRGTALTRTFQCGEPDEFKTLFVEGTEW